MFGQLAADEAFAFFIYYSIFPLHSPVLPYGVSRFAKNISSFFLFFPIFSVFLHNHIGCTLQSC